MAANAKDCTEDGKIQSALILACLDGVLEDIHQEMEELEKKQAAGVDIRMTREELEADMRSKGITNVHFVDLTPGWMQAALDRLS